MSAMSNRIGTFKVDDRFFNKLEPGDGTNLFHDMVVLDIRHDYLSRDRTYFAVHPAFRPVLQGEKYPEYIAIFRDGTALPEWQELKPTGETLDEAVQKFNARAAAHRERERVVRDWHPPTEARSDIAGYRERGVYQQGEFGRLVDIQRAGWRGRLDRLLQRGLALVCAVLGRRNATAADHLPQGRQLLRPGFLGAFDRGQQHDANRDGVSGQGARGDARGAGSAGLAQAAGGRSAPPRTRVDFDPTEDHWADSDAGPYCCGQVKDGGGAPFS